MTLLDRAAFSQALTSATMAMTRRGIRVDDELRRTRITALEAHEYELLAEANQIGVPLLQAHRGRVTAPHLFYPRSGKKPLLKPELLARVVALGVEETRAREALKEVLVRYLRAKNVFWQVNLGSTDQMCELLYNVLKMPVRRNEGKPTVDEEALQSLMPVDSTGIVRCALRYAKLDTMRAIYERIRPAADGHVRTVQNPAGTYTFRFSHKSAFYVECSTNLANLPNVEAKRDPLYSVRDCLVPDPGEVFIEADLSAADTWSVACLSEDEPLLEMLRSGTDIHKFTAANILGCQPEAVTKVQRNVIGKVTRHAGSFGEGWNSLMRRINGQSDLTGLTATAAQAKRWTLDFQRLHPNLDAVWWNRVEQTLLTGQPMRAFTGQTCNFYPRIDPESGQLDPASLRAAIAWEPQYNTSMLAKMALAEMFRAETGSNWRVLLDCHDAMLLGVPKARLHHAARAVKQAMERTVQVHKYPMRVPVEVFVARERWSEKERVL